VGLKIGGPASREQEGHLQKSLR